MICSEIFKFFLLLGFSTIAFGQLTCVWVKSVKNVDIFYYSAIRGAMKAKLSDDEAQLGPQSNCSRACETYTKFKCTAFIWARKAGGTDGDCYVYGQIAPTTVVLVKKGTIESIHDLYDLKCNGAVPSHRVCSFNVTHTNIVANVNSMATHMTRARTTDQGVVDVQDCQQRCVVGALLPQKQCTAFSITPDSSTNSICYTYSNIVVSAIQTTGTATLFQLQCSVDCVYSTWTVWSSCSASCNGGSQTRSRTIVTAASGGGVACNTGLLSQTQTCNTAGCKVDCKYSAYSAWSACSKPCGTGTQSKSRTIVVAGQNGGIVCDSTTLIVSQGCNTHLCPNDCTVSLWGSWSSCTLACGGGSWTRTRTIVVAAANGGVCNFALIETATCNSQPCAVDCTWSGWGNWGACSVNCGGGTQSRTRTVIKPAANGGSCTGSSTSSQICGTVGCAMNCTVSAWSAYGACSVNCGGGTQKRTRTVIVQAINGGLCLDALSSTQPCGTVGCPVNCVLSGWGAWGACSVNCGGGTQSRTRTVIKQAANGGTCIGSLVSTQICGTVGCPMNCTVSLWGNWGACSVNCGGGTQTRTRTVVVVAVNGGYCLDALSSSQSCNTVGCPVDCVWSGWGAWGACSANCGGGTQTHTRTKIRDAANGGKCTGATSGSQVCNTHGCPVNCVVSNWANWGACSVPCGGGTQSRVRTITKQAINGGTCTLALSTSQSCNTQGCPSNCVFSGWTTWGSCTKSCGTGSQTSTRTIIKQAINGGSCIGALSKSQSCNTNGCPVNCVVSAWANWGVCSLSCGGGTQSRVRTITTKAINGGNCLHALSASQSCNTQGCPQSCVFAGWSTWGSCTKPCGTGSQTSTRTIIKQAVNGGSCIGALSKSQACNKHGCPVNCAVSAWANWGACSVSCGGGTQSKIRTITTQAINGGTCTLALSASQACNTQSCPVDCVWSGWSAYGSCSKNCGSGTQSRTRTVIKEAANGGSCIGAATESKACNTHGCARNCVVSAWTAYGACSVSCGGGTQKRTRTITTQAANGGVCLDALSETKVCNTAGCPKNCLVTAWSGWGTCSASCGGGSHSRVRFIIQAAVNGGTCGFGLSATKTCNTNVGCAVNCVVSNWAAWSACTKSCGTGTQIRIRTITKQSLNGGTCKPLKDTQACSTPLCPKNCTVTPWSGWGSCSVTCGSGTRSRVRFIIQAASNGGVCGYGLTGAKACSTPCPTNCAWSAWAAWGSCSVTCGQGAHSRFRLILTPGGNGGAVCNDADKTSSGACTMPACPPPWNWLMLASYSINVTHRLSTKGYAVIQSSQNCSADCLAYTGFDCRAYVWNGVKGSACYLHGKIDRYISLTNVSVSNYYLYEKHYANESSNYEYIWTIYLNVDEKYKMSNIGYKNIGVNNDCGMACINFKEFNCRAYVWKGPGSVCYLHGEINQGIHLRFDSTWVLYVRYQPSVAPWYSLVYMVYEQIDPKQRLNSQNFAVVYKQSSRQICQQSCISHTAFKCAAYAWSPTNGNCYLHGVVQNDIVFQHGSPFTLYAEVRQNTLSSSKNCRFVVIKQSVAPEAVPAQTSRVVNVTRTLDLPHCELLCKMQFYGRQFSCDAFAFDPSLATSRKQSQSFDHQKLPNCWLFEKIGDTSSVKTLSGSSWELYKEKCA